MAEMVRIQSVLLKQVSTLDVFNVITRHSDPKIALYLSTAKDRNTNQLLFPTEGSIKEIMFADPAREGLTNLPNRHLIAHGLRGISADLTAAMLIHQLAIIDEQFKHGDSLRNDAHKRIDQIILTYELKSSTAFDDSTQSDNSATAFYFESKDFTLPDSKKLLVEWYMPHVDGMWVNSGEYLGTISTATVVADLVDNINARSVQKNDYIIAVAKLSGPYASASSTTFSQFHHLTFYPRFPSKGILAHSINIRIQVMAVVSTTEDDDSFPLHKAPFNWGCFLDSTNTYPVNGTLIITEYNKLSTSAKVINSLTEYNPSVIFLRNKWFYAIQDEPLPPYQAGRTKPISYSEPPALSALRFRVQPFQPNMVDQELDQKSTYTISVPREGDDNARYSQLAVLFNNALAKSNLDTKTAGAIIRNDDPTDLDPMAVIELTAWDLSSYKTIILDILEVPEDIEIAVGDRYGPRSSFSTLPKSILVENALAGKVAAAPIYEGNKHSTVNRFKSNLWQRIEEEEKELQKHNKENKGRYPSYPPPQPSPLEYWKMPFDPFDCYPP
jgi:hypothetical protein